MIRLKRVYEPASAEDGARFLVERLWPRGIKKESLRLDAWIREVAPSTELRHWFGHDAAKWDGFRRRYRAELDAHPNAWRPLVDAARRGSITLLYSTHDVAHNNAVALKDYLGTAASISSAPSAGIEARATDSRCG
jgi:uncharacterized protein YeaO (DUF488 family)